MSFTFKQFTICDSGAAMKVGTDGVLLGAWTSPHGQRILDIGTGSGLIALMLAQRNPDAIIDAIDIDPDAVRQAQANFKASPWANRLTAQTADINTFSAPPYDLIVANPPFFTNALPAHGQARHQARHTDTLTLPQLFASASRLLQQQGQLAVVLPNQVRLEAIARAEQSALFLHRATTVFTLPTSPPKRVLLQFSPTPASIIQTDHLHIHDLNNNYTQEYIKLTRDFYLNF